MKETPILMSDEMVRALLANRKTQTRRIAKFKPYTPGASLNLNFSGLDLGFYCTGVPSSGYVLRTRGAGGCWNDRTKPLHCPYGKVGDRLWVRETFCSCWGPAYPEAPAQLVRTQGRENIPQTDGGASSSSADNPLHVFYRASCGDKYPHHLKWRPSIFMPRWASRLTLELTEVRVERLQAISDADAIAEGAQHFPDLPIGKLTRFSHRADRWAFGSPRDTDQCLASAKWAYANLWNEINGDGSWEKNPYVWCLAFRRVDDAC